MAQEVDRKLVLAEFDGQVAALERVCAKMKEARLQIERGFELSDVEFMTLVQNVAESIAAEMALL